MLVEEIVMAWAIEQTNSADVESVVPDRIVAVHVHLGSLAAV